MVVFCTFCLPPWEKGVSLCMYVLTFSQLSSLITYRYDNDRIGAGHGCGCSSWALDTGGRPGGGTVPLALPAALALPLACDRLQDQQQQCPKDLYCLLC